MLSAFWFGSCWRENVLGVHKENTINYSLCSSFITKDYHPQSIHHTEKAVCTLHTSTAIWKNTGLRKNIQTCEVLNVSQKTLIHCATGNRSKWACVCVCLCVWCMRHITINPPCLLIWLLFCHQEMHFWRLYQQRHDFKVNATCAF